MPRQSISVAFISGVGITDHSKNKVSYYVYKGHDGGGGREMCLPEIYMYIYLYKKMYPQVMVALERSQWWWWWWCGCCVLQSETVARRALLQAQTAVVWQEWGSAPIRWRRAAPEPHWGVQKKTIFWGPNGWGWEGGREKRIEEAEAEKTRYPNSPVLLDDSKKTALSERERVKVVRRTLSSETDDLQDNLKWTEE